MNRERLMRRGLIVMMLTFGLLVGRYFNTHLADPPQGGSSFREWFWEQRGFDLLVQVALIFVGALGVAAILPHYYERHLADDIGRLERLAVLLFKRLDTDPGEERQDR